MDIHYHTDSNAIFLCERKGKIFAFSKSSPTAVLVSKGYSFHQNWCHKTLSSYKKSLLINSSSKLYYIKEVNKGSFNSKISLNLNLLKEERVSCAEFISEETVIAATSTGRVILYNLPEGKIEACQMLADPDYVIAMALNQSRDQVAISTNEDRISGNLKQKALYWMKIKKESNTLTLMAYKPLEKGVTITSLCFSRQEEYGIDYLFATRCFNKGRQISCFRVKEWNSIVEIENLVKLEGGLYISALRAFDNGRQLVCSSQSGEITTLKM